MGGAGLGEAAGGVEGGPASSNRGLGVRGMGELPPPGAKPPFQPSFYLSLGRNGAPGVGGGDEVVETGEMPPANHRFKGAHS